MQRIRLRGTVVSRQLAREGLSQNAFACQVGISPGYMSQLLSGKRCPGPKLRPRIQSAPSLKQLSFDELFELLEPQNNGAQ